MEAPTYLQRPAISPSVATQTTQNTYEVLLGMANGMGWAKAKIQEQQG